MAAIQPLPVEVAVIFTMAAIPILIAVWFISGKDSGKGWRGGKNDPFRLLLHTEDGTPRPEMKPLLSFWIVVSMAITWMLAFLKFV
jgi:hypothetical protein